MDQSQRANAAQLAARNIKQAKPKGRRPATGSRPDSVPQFASMPGQNAGGSGGLFGGSVQGGGSFNFAPPAGVPSFPPTTFGAQSQSFGTPSPDVSDNEGRFEGDNRATKRQFGGSSTIPQSNSFPPFGQSQTTNPFASSTQLQNSGSNIFSFGDSQSQAPSGINFNSSTPNSFTFGGTSSQPAPSSSSISFGSGLVENKPSGNPFNFGGQQNQGGSSIFNFNQPTPAEKPANSPFQFGQTSSQTATSGQTITQEKPASAPFQFGQTSTQTTSSGINFNSVPATAAASPNFNFGSAPPTNPTSSGFNFGSTTSASPSINFGSMSTTQTPTTNLFGTTKASDNPQPTNLFASTSQAPTSSLFSNLNSPAPSTNNLFGKPIESAAPTSNLFGSQNPTPAKTTNDIFGQNKATPSTSNLFTEKKTEATPNNIFSASSQAPATHSLFGEKNSEPASSNVFANLNKPAPSNFFGNSAQQPATTTNLFSSPSKESSPANDLFGNLNKPVAPSVTQPKINGSNDVPKDNNLKPNTLFNTPPAIPSVQAKAPFSPSTASATTPPVESNRVNKSSYSLDSMQPSSIQSAPKNNIFSPLKPVDAPAAASQPPPSGMFPSLSQPIPSLQGTIDASGLPSNRYLPTMPQEGDAIAELIATRSITDDEMQQRVPGNFSTEDIQKFFATFRITALNKAMQKIWSTIGMRDPTPAFNYYNEERSIILSHYSVVLTQLKRKSSDHADDQNPSKRSKHGDQPILAEPSNKRKVANDEEENQSPNKRNRQLESSGPVLNGAAQTSASQPSQSNPLNTNGTSTKMPSLPAPSNSSPSKSKRKATEELTQNTEQLSPLRREMKTPKLNGATNTPQSGSQTSNIFKNILESPSDSSSLKLSPQKKISSPEKPQDETPRFNPFGSLAVPKSPTKAPASQPAPAAKIFTPSSTAAPSSLFSVKPTSNVQASETNGQNNSLKMPTFNSGSNFLAQFGAQAKKSEEEEEAAKLQRAKDEDMDSDDDEAEFEAEWRKKRAAEKKELEEIAKTGQRFKFGSIETKSVSKPSAEPTTKTSEATASKSLFGQGAISQGSGESVFGSLNGSRTSTPGPFGSSTGSVLDGHTPGKPVSFGNNIFGHLSDADSGKGDEGDDDSADGESSTEDSEKKDPNYKPQAEIGSGTPPEKTGAGIASTKKVNPFGLPSTFGSISGTSSPGGSLFGRASKDSSKVEEGAVQDKDNGGTTTPGGSLFDRITKDGNGNPVRHVSTEEKENTQPSSRNIFGDLKTPFGASTSKTSAPSDQTWKPDSPIKFGTTSNDVSSAPIIDVTSATPTKSGSPSNLFGGSSSIGTTTPQNLSTLFGNKADSKPFSNLFGIPGTPKSAPNAVGFGFGAPSAPSSLFPSAAGSATTSRATTPGATTDGESGGDVDPDAEHHEQINLTAGGPGEENEEAVYEVRAKALKFCPKDEGDASNPWETKGVGPLRILKHKETKVSRILMRADPSGTIVLNKGILGGVKYEATGKTLKLLTTSDNGKGMETYILQVKTPDFAQKLAEALEANKASS